MSHFICKNLILCSYYFPREDAKLEWWMRFLPMTLTGDSICCPALSWIKHPKKNIVVTLCRKYGGFYFIHNPGAESRERSDNMFLGTHQAIICRMQHRRSQQFTVQVRKNLSLLQAPLPRQKGRAAAPAQPAQWNTTLALGPRQMSTCCVQLE